MHHLHLAVSFTAAKADLVKIFKYGGPKIKEAIAFILRKAAEAVRRT